MLLQIEDRGPFKILTCRVTAVPRVFSCNSVCLYQKKKETQNVS